VFLVVAGWPADMGVSFIPQTVTLVSGYIARWRDSYKVPPWFFCSMM
jgi:hypothetical protein